MMPGISVLSPVPGESKEGLDEALKKVEAVIEELMSEGVPSENIVVTGVSQGGCLTLWTAMYCKYKLGGFVPIVAWLPLAKVEKIPDNPINKDTPIFHMNGMMDPIVPWVPAGTITKRKMKEVFSNYEFKAIFGTTHTTTAPNPVTTPKLADWLKRNTTLKFK